MRKLLAAIAILCLGQIVSAQSYTNFPNLQSGNMNFTATIRANGSACASGTAVVSGGGSVSCVAVIPASEKGANSGVATLDSGGKVPSSQLPFSGLTYDGSWNANTNSPTLADGSGTSGHFYIVSVAGSQNLGSGSISFAVGDWALYNGTVWQKVPSSAAVSSVFGRTGAVTATAGDYTATQVTNTPAGGIAATTAQAAINELDTEKQAAASTLTSWAALTRASGFDTFTQTPSSANLRGLLTDEVGTGAAYFIGGALSTPASVTLTNGTGLPWSTGLTGTPTTAVGYGITGGAKLDAYAGGDTPSAFTLGIVDSADAATWRAALGAGTSSTTGTVTSVSGSGGSTGLTLTGGPITTSGTLTIGGTLADGSLSSNVPLKNAANSFTATQSVTTTGSNFGLAITTNNSATDALSLVDSSSTYHNWRVGPGTGGAGFGIYDVTATRLPLAIGTGGNVTINAPSSGTALSVASSTTQRGIQVASASGQAAQISLLESGQTEAAIQTSGGVLSLYNGANRIDINSAGNVSMAIPSSGNTLLLNASSAAALRLQATAASGAAQISFGQTGQSDSAIYNVPSSNALGIYANGADRMFILNGVQVGSPTGGDKGAGTLNTAGGIYQNNVSVCLNDGTNCGVLNASNISSGTLNNSRLPATLNATTDVQVGGVSLCRSNGTNCPNYPTSGTWSPSITLTNGTGATTYRALYQRVGNVVSGGFTVAWSTVTAASTAATISIPISSDFSSSFDVTGTCNVFSSTGASTAWGRLLSDYTADRFSVSFPYFFSAPADLELQCSYSYIVQ